MSPVLKRRAPGVLAKGLGINRSAVCAGSFQYPRATPAPPIKISPVTPTGTGSRLPSRIKIAVLLRGLPTRQLRSVDAFITDESTRIKVDQTVVSVGP